MTYAQFRAAQDPELLAQVMQRDLEELYGNVFPEGVDVSVEVVFDDDHPARYRVDMSVRVTENDQAYDLHAALSPAVNALGEYERFDIFFN